MDEKLGALGTYPEGKLTDDDEGALRLAITTGEGSVFLNFGKPVTWIGMPPEQAVEMAEAIISAARKVAKQQGKTLTLTIN